METYRHIVLYLLSVLPSDVVVSQIKVFMQQHTEILDLWWP